MLRKPYLDHQISLSADPKWLSVQCSNSANEYCTYRMFMEEILNSQLQTTYSGTLRVYDISPKNTLRARPELHWLIKDLLHD